MKRFLAALAVAATLLPSTRAAALDRTAWLADFDQLKQLIVTRYANLEWLAFDRGADLSGWFGDARRQIERAPGDAEAKAAFDQLMRRMGDGHTRIDWPAAAVSGGAAATESSTSPCEQLGFGSAHLHPAFPARMAGFRDVAGPHEFPAGLAHAGGRQVGVVRIEQFGPEFAPELCAEALTALHVNPDGPCDDVCRKGLETWLYARLTDDFAATIRGLRRAGAQVLLVDLTDNGGGSEWAEATARMVTARRLVAGRLAFVRGEAWTRKWTQEAAQLREGAASETGQTRAWLLQLAENYEARAKEATAACDGSPMVERKPASCRWNPAGYYATGAVGAAKAGAYRGKPWAPVVFTPSEYAYQDGVWSGPLIVLVNYESWSAAEEFAAILQDNRAAVVMGSPTGGAGCGHAVEDEAPLKLANSGGSVVLPDCVRLRRDGTNEVAGVQPDVLVGLRRYDGPQRQAALLAAKLPEAARRAEALARRR